MNIAAATALYAYGTPEGACKAVKTRGQTPREACGGQDEPQAKKNGGRDTRSLDERYSDIMSRIKDPSAGSRSNPIRAGTDLQMAAVLIAKGKHVRLNQPDQVSSLVDMIKREAEEMRTAGRRPPDWNLADISVEGTNLFAPLHKNIPRVEMPQLAGLVDPGSRAAALLPKTADLSRDEVDLAPKFIEELRTENIRLKAVTIPASHLRCTQSELDGAKVGAIAQRMRDGKMKHATIFVTRDNYILDGHHRWAATIVNDARDGHMGDLHMSAYKLDLDIGTALTRARDFQRRWGVAPAGMGHYVKAAARRVRRLRGGRRWVI